MRLEIRKLAGEDVPFIVFDCAACGEGIAVREREMKTSRPLHCSSCNHSRYISYREYIVVTEKFAPQLLEFTVAKFGGIRPRFRSCN